MDDDEDEDGANEEEDEEMFGYEDEEYAQQGMLGNRQVSEDRDEVVGEEYGHNGIHVPNYQPPYVAYDQQGQWLPTTQAARAYQYQQSLQQSMGAQPFIQHHQMPDSSMDTMNYDVEPSGYPLSHDSSVGSIPDMPYNTMPASVSPLVAAAAAAAAAVTNSGPTRRKSSAAAIPIIPADPVPLYPTVPKEFLPPFLRMESLIDLHAAYYHSNIHIGTHLPTLKQQMRRGTADPTLLLVILWSGLLMASKSDDGEGNELGNCMDPDALERECMSRMRVEALELLASDDPDVRRVVRLIQALLISRTILIGKGTPVESDIHAYVYRLQPLAKFGQLPEDVAPRDPKNFAAWIESESRARTNVTLLLSDVGLSDVLQRYPRFLPNYRDIPPILGPPPFRTPYPSVAEFGHSYPWLNMTVPCSDMLFDGLPAAPTTKEDWKSWAARDRAMGGILDKEAPLYTVRELVSWIDLPVGSTRRNKLVRHVAGDVLRNGLSALFVVNFDFWARMVHCQEFFADKGFLMYDPPMGNSEDEVVARETRQRLLEALEEFFANLPEDIKMLDQAADGKGLKEMAARWWGWERRHRL